MGNSDQQAFEQTVVSFLKDFVTVEMGVNITIESATVFHQTIVNGTRRRLQQGGLNVYFSIVATVLPGDSNNFDFASVVKTTFDRFESEFLSSLAKASPFFSSDSISTSTQQIESSKPTSMHATIYVSVAAAVSVVIVFAVGVWVRRRSRRFQQRSLPSDHSSLELDTSAGQISPVPVSPSALERSSDSTGSGLNGKTEQSDNLSRPTNNRQDEVVVAKSSKTMYLTSVTNSMSLDNGYEEESEVSSISSYATPASPSSLEEGKRTSKARISNRRALSKRDSKSKILTPIPELAASLSGDNESSRFGKVLENKVTTNNESTVADRTPLHDGYSDASLSPSVKKDPICRESVVKENSAPDIDWGDGATSDVDDDILYFNESINK
jgi:hypothetical protein